MYVYIYISILYIYAHLSSAVFCVFLMNRFNCYTYIIHICVYIYFAVGCLLIVIGASKNEINVINK